MIGGGTGLSTLLKGLKQYVRPAAEASSTVSNAAGGEINIADLTAVLYACHGQDVARAMPLTPKSPMRM